MTLIPEARQDGLEPTANADRRDRQRKAGGIVSHLGMPVDPGNLMMFGALGEVPVIGVPSWYVRPWRRVNS